MAAEQVLDVVYEDGAITIVTDRRTYVRSYSPALLIHPVVYGLIEEYVEGVHVVRHPLSVELRGDLDALVDIMKVTARISDAYIFLPPERAFMLDTRIRPFSLLRDGNVSLSVPPLDSPEKALKYLLFGVGVPHPRVFFENALYAARVVANTSMRYGKINADAGVLLDVVGWNISPDTICNEGFILPSSFVRVRGCSPTLFPSFWSDVDVGYGKGIMEYCDGATGILADAECIGASYDVIRPVCTSAKMGVIPRAILSLIRKTHMRKLLSVPPGDILEIARRTSTPERETEWNLLGAVYDILSNMPEYLLRSNVLSPLGRLTLLVARNLRLRSQELYKRLYPHIPICSQGLKELEYFLRVLSSLRSELPLSSMYQRGL